jgi:FecR protein/Protein of unknown function (DUF3352)
MTEEHFDELLKEMREETTPAEQVTAVRERVWQRLKGASSVACAELRPQFADYLAGRLTASRLLLVEDHLGRCAECRHVLAEAKGERRVVAMPQFAGARWSGWTRWAVAAGVVLAALYLGRDRIDRALAPAGPRATVASVSGEVYRLPAGALARGESIAEGEVVRTAAGAHVVLALADGSQVEVNQRTEVALRAAWSGMTIHLGRGDIIVQAAKQRRGSLRVTTRDSVASVKGTIFSVSTGTAGSVVSVVAGAVAVAQPRAQVVLTAGQQAASSRALQDVGVRETISWSEDAEKYYSLLEEFSGIEKELAATPGPQGRTESYLLGYLPAGALAYFAIPNLDGTIRQALSLVDRRAEENPVLNEWWSSDDGRQFRDKLDRIQAITPLLGDEVVCILNPYPGQATRHIPLILAQIQAGREDELPQAIARIAGENAESITYQIAGDLLVISDSPEDLAAMMPQLGSGAASEFATELHGRYQRGVNWLVAVNVAEFAPEFKQMSPQRLLGMENMSYVFFEQGPGDGRDDMEATVSFAGSRVGIVSWLAPPGSSGSAEYVSDQAIAVASGSTRDPRQALDELLALAGQDSPFTAHVAEFESKTGISLANDIASSLGTDFTFAVEQPSLPMPGWVAVFEAINPGALDNAARMLVDAFNAHLTAEETDSTLTLAQETVNGRVWNSVQSAGSLLKLYWTYDRGYLVASMDRAVAARAIAVRDSGSSLVRSASFQERYPVTSLHNSGFFWLNTNGVLADLASYVDSPALQRLAGSRDPVLIVVDGERERIHAASRTRLTSLILDLMLVHRTGPQIAGPDQTKNELHAL